MEAGAQQNDWTDVLRVEPQPGEVICRCGDGRAVRLPVPLGAFVRPSNRLLFAATSETLASAVLIQRGDGCHSPMWLYARFGGASLPRINAPGDWCVPVSLSGTVAGLTAVRLLSTTVRDYFYRGDRRRAWGEGPTLYQVLGVARDAQPGELRLAYRLRAAEARSGRPPGLCRRDLERAYNVLALPDLRACYDGLLADADAPANLPYSRGWLLAVGRLAREGGIFFVRNILHAVPELVEHRLRYPFRRLEFTGQGALMHERRRGLRAWLDPVSLGLAPDLGWNAWKRHVAGHLRVRACCVAAAVLWQGGDRLRPNVVALPSRTEVELPQSLSEQVARAQAQALPDSPCEAWAEDLRRWIGSTAVSLDALQERCRDLGLPGSADPLRLLAEPGLELDCVEELRHTARRVYVLPDQVLFECEHAVVAEPLRRRRATCVYARPNDLLQFLAAYESSQRVGNNNADSRAKPIPYARVVHDASRVRWRRAVGLPERSWGVPADWSANVKSL